MTDIYRQKVNDLNRRAQQLGAKGRLNADDLYAVLEYFGGHCLVPDCTNTDVQFDHVVPLEKQGLNARRNLQLLCESHNKAKSEIDYREGRICPDDFVAKQGEKESHKHETGRETDWERIKTRYITEQITLHELANAEGITIASILKRAERGKWVELRDNYRLKVSAEVVETLKKQEVNARLLAIETSKAVIDSWLHSIKNEATASEALGAVKLILVLNGIATDKTESKQTGTQKIIIEYVGADQNLPKVIASSTGAD